MLKSINEYTIIPAVTTTIEHREECNPYAPSFYLPLFTAPMSSVINTDNAKYFSRYVHTIIPRHIELKERLKFLGSYIFIAVSLKEFEDLLESDYFKPNIEEDNLCYICIDLANGHMQKLLDLCLKAKNMYGRKITLMTGNIANPETYKLYCQIGIDYVRVGIGGGSVCLTSANTGVHYPMGSLLEHIGEIKRRREKEDSFTTKVVADGGFSNFDQIIKALALGADYVMLGRIFAKCKEAVCAESGEYYGMSTKKAQKEMGKEGNTTSEGISTSIITQYSLAEWISNFTHYLRSAMSYTNSRTLKEFCDGSHIREMSIDSYRYYAK